MVRQDLKVRRGLRDPQENEAHPELEWRAHVAERGPRVVQVLQDHQE